MNANTQLDRRLADYLAGRSTFRAPEGLLESTMARVDGAGQRGWLRIVRPVSPSPTWLPAVRRGVGLAVAVGLMLVLFVLLALAVGSRRPVVAPLGLARPGLIAFEAGNRIYVANADGSGKHPITLGPALDSYPAWSHDGTRVAYISQRVASAPFEVRVADAQGTNQIVVATGLSYANTAAGTCCEAPALDWSRDDRWLVFAAATDETREPRIVVASADGSSQWTLGTSDLGGLDPTWSPDGKEIAFARVAPEPSIWVVSADGSGLHRLTTVRGEGDSFYRPQWSPDGRRLAFQAGSEGDLGIYLINRDGSDEHPVDDAIRACRSCISSDATMPVWSPDGSALAWLGLTSQAEIAGLIVVGDSDGLHPRVIYEGPLQPTPLIWSPDARHLLAHSPASDHTPKLLIVDVTGQTQPVAIPAEETYANASWQRLPP